MIFEQTIKMIQPLNPEFRSQGQAKLDRLTKPVGSLGRLEELAILYVGILEDLSPSLPKSMVLTLAADHGVTADGVSAYPSSVTAQMVQNFLSGGAAINVLARQVGAEVRIVDLGVASDISHFPGLLVRKVGWGTKNFFYGPAMSREEARQSVETGIALVREAYGEGIRLVAPGDMGIGNTTSSAAITAVMTGQPVSQVTGKGTGIDDAARARKVSLIERALEINHPHPDDAVDVLAKVGGFEIGGMVGVILGGAACHIPVVLDGFISGAAALLAVAMAPNCREYLIASHVSAELGHRAALDTLGLNPLLDLHLRLGEGTGACLAFGLIQSSLRVLTEMATFEEAGVDEAVTGQQEEA